MNILIYDTDKVTTRLLAADLRREKRFEVDDTHTSDDVSGMISAKSPSVLLLSVRLNDPASATLTLLRKIRNDFPGVRIIVFSDWCGREVLAEFFRAGARGFFDRSRYDLSLLCLCIERVAEGQVWANSEQLGAVLDAFSETTAPPSLGVKGVGLLTPRERDVVRLVADGLPNREIARHLNLSAHTVKNHLLSVFDKIGVSSRAKLIMYVLSNQGRNDLLNTAAAGSKRPPLTQSEPAVKLIRTTALWRSGT